MKWIARTHEFRVKDKEAFLAWAEYRLLEVCELGGDQDPNLFALGAGPRIDSWRYGPERSGRYDYAQELAAHLAEGEVAVMFFAGGTATAIHWDGQLLQFEPEDLTRLAAERLREMLMPKQPAQAVVVFGEEMSRAVDHGEPLSDDLGGWATVVSYPTESQLQAYLDGVDDGVGYLDHTVAAGGGYTHDQYLEALRENPGLDFMDWYNQNLNQYSNGDDLSKTDQ